MQIATAMDVEPKALPIKPLKSGTGQAPGLAPSLNKLTPDLIRSISNSLLVYKCDSAFKVAFMSKLKQLCRPSSDIQLRKAALDALGVFGGQNVQARIGAYLRDSHAVARLAAARALLCLFHRNIPLSVSLLEPIKASALDDCEQIRSESAELMWALACSQPDYVISFEPVVHRLADVLFILLCQLSFDGSVKIRTKAIRFLGAISGSVDKRLILQTFSKVPLTELISGARQSARFQFDSTDFGNLVTQKAFVEICERRSIPIPDHVAGVFVHGLEDEFASIRQASLDAMYAISLRTEMVALTAFDFLIDIFNDELLQVRIASIQAVCGLIRRYPSISFSQVQLMSLLSNLSDYERLTRHETLRLLKTVTLRNGASLQATLVALLRCLSSFPEDQDVIFDTVQNIGSSHSELARLVIERWYAKDPSAFDQQSLVTSGSSYLAFLLFVQSVRSTASIDVLPSSFKTSLDYCRDRFDTCRETPQNNFQSQPWNCPNGIVKAANETFVAWLGQRYSQAKTCGDRLRALLCKQASDIATAKQAGLQFCQLYAEWIWICCTVLSGEFISLANYEERAKQIVFLLSETFFGLSNVERSHVALLQKFTLASPRWWPITLSLKRLDVSIRSPRSDPENPLTVRPQAASIIRIEADFKDAYQYQKLAIRIEINEKLTLHNIPAKDIVPGNGPWSFALKTKIRITCNDLTVHGKDPVSIVLIGFVWRDQPEWWLPDPVKLYLHVIS